MGKIYIYLRNFQHTVLSHQFPCSILDVIEMSILVLKKETKHIVRQPPSAQVISYCKLPFKTCSTPQLSTIQKITFSQNVLYLLNLTIRVQVVEKMLCPMLGSSCWILYFKQSIPDIFKSSASSTQSWYQAFVPTKHKQWTRKQCKPHYFAKQTIKPLPLLQPN